MATTDASPQGAVPLQRQLNSLLPFGFKHQREWMDQLRSFLEAGGTAKGYSSSGSLVARATRVHEDRAGPKAYREC